MQEFKNTIEKIEYMAAKFEPVMQSRVVAYKCNACGKEIWRSQDGSFGLENHLAHCKAGVRL